MPLLVPCSLDVVDYSVGNCKIGSLYALSFVPLHDMMQQIETHMVGSCGWLLLLFSRAPFVSH